MAIQPKTKSFSIGTPEAKAEILWAFLTVKRNLAFLLSDYITPFLTAMLTDSTIASKIKINRKKTKEIIQNVLQGYITQKKISSLKNHSL